MIKSEFQEQRQAQSEKVEGRRQKWERQMACRDRFQICLICEKAHKAKIHFLQAER